MRRATASTSSTRSNERDLERNRDAGALRRRCARAKVTKSSASAAAKRQVDRVEPRGAKRRVVHRRRDRVRDRQPDDAVDVGRVGHVDGTGSRSSKSSRATAARRPRARPHTSTPTRTAPASTRVAMPASPIAMSTMPRRRSARPRAPRAAAGSRSAESPSTAILTTSAPVARIARTRSRRSAGTPAKSCDDRTMRRPAVAGDQIVEVRASTRRRRTRRRARAPRPRSRRRSSSAPANSPPSHAGRHVTIDRAPAARERAGDVRDR